MRILNLRFKNLNSLVGEWNIDFSQPAFADEGIFAITGPTGSGKSTILDAICLALYGRTPRLNKISKSSNEIMSRQSSECFAEVSFQTAGGTFRCHFCQHRANKRVTGDLQAPKHEIIDAITNKVIEHRSRDVARAIENATGMDFDRFTRSMLLAQGDFAAFLKASADQRAPILEQITGTEIYSRISIHVHQIKTRAAMKLQELEYGLDGSEPLSAEDEQQLLSSLSSMTEEEKRTNELVSESARSLAWAQGIVTLNSEIKLLDEQRLTFSGQLTAFAPQREKLELSKSALGLAAEYAGLKNVRAEQEKNTAKLSDFLHELSQIEEKHKNLLEKQTEIEADLEKHKIEKQQTFPMIRRLRDLDLLISEKKMPLEVAQKELENIDRSITEANEDKVKNQDQLNRFAKEQEQLSQELEASQPDESLIRELSGLDERMKKLQVDFNEFAKLSTAAVATAKATETSAAALSSSAAKLKIAESEYLASAKLLAQKEEKLKELLDGENLSVRLDIANKLKQRLNLLAQVQSLLGTINNCKQKIEQLNTELFKLQPISKVLSEKLLKQNALAEMLEKELDLLLTQAVLLKKIENLSTLREQLADGTACPLCGALEHPFAQGNLPKFDATQKNIKESRAKIAEVKAVVSQLQIEQSRTDSELTHLADEIRANSELLELTISSFTENCQKLDILPEEAAKNASLNELIEINTAKIEQANQRITQIIAHEDEIKLANQSCQTSQQVYELLRNDYTERTHQQAKLKEEVDRQQIALAEHKKNTEQSLNALLLELAPYGITSLSLENIEEQRQKLDQRRKTRQEKQNKLSAISLNIPSLKSRIAYLADELEKLQKTRLHRQKTVQELVLLCETLITERLEKFGDKIPDKWEADLNAGLEKTEKELQQAQKNQNEAKENLTAVTARVEELRKNIVFNTAKLSSLTDDFTKAAKLKGFLDEAAYIVATLTAEELTALESRAKNLDDSGIELNTKYSNLKIKLASELAKNLSENNPEQIGAEHEAAKTALKELQERIGAAKQSLKDNKELQQRKQVLLQSIAAQKKESSRWDNLHGIIGSSDGKKFRNFAQGLTFDIVVNQANHQLQKMSDRYLLVRAADNPLDLDVLDNYQAGEIRSSKNLSGGESFIVSLALALGLSQMASRNVRVDSLFLDEGFGTLDDDALETALDTLSSLKNENKLIGIISHVPAIRDRISTQVEVRPESGGRSRIKLPGAN